MSLGETVATMTMPSRLQVHLEKDIRRRAYMAYIIRSTPGRPDRQLTFVVEVEEIDDTLMGAHMQPSIVDPVDGGLLQALMDALWEAGARPKGHVETAPGIDYHGQLMATEAHLADMRAIAFQKLAMDVPDPARALQID